MTQISIPYLIMGIIYVAAGVLTACLACRYPKIEPSVPREGVEKEFYFSKNDGDLWYRVAVWHNNDLIKTYYVNQSRTDFEFEREDLMSVKYISKDLADSLFAKGENDLKIYKETHDKIN